MLLSLLQQQLVLSILPYHVANEISQDLSGISEIRQFRKIYMSRHENVRLVTKRVGHLKC